MCRQGFVYLKEAGNVTDFVKLVTTSYSTNGNRDGMGITWVMKDKKDGHYYFQYAKYAGKALDFWLVNRDVKIVSNMILFHLRQKTSGKQNIESTHPFFSEDGQIALTHNGVIFRYEKMRKDLESKGHVFTSDVDSEIFLHAYEEYGDDMIKEINKADIGGNATILIIDLKLMVFKCYTDNHSLIEYTTKQGIVGMSDDLLDMPSKTFEIDSWYTLKLMEKELLGKVPSKISIDECFNITKSKVGGIGNWASRGNNNTISRPGMYEDQFGYWVTTDGITHWVARAPEYISPYYTKKLADEVDGNPGLKWTPEEIRGHVFDLYPEDQFPGEAEYIIANISEQTIMRMIERGTEKHMIRLAKDNDKHKQKQELLKKVPLKEDEKASEDVNAQI